MLSLVFSLNRKDFIGVLNDKINRINKIVTPVTAETREKFADMGIIVATDDNKMKKLPAKIEMGKITEYPDNTVTYLVRLGGKIYVELDINQLDKITSVVPLKEYYIRTTAKGAKVLTGKKGYTAESIPRIKVFANKKKSASNTESGMCRSNKDNKKLKMSNSDLYKVKEVRFIDDTNYKDGLENDGGCYKFWTKFTRLSNWKWLISYGTSSDMEYCPVCGKFAEHYIGKGTWTKSGYSCGEYAIIPEEEVLHIINSYKETDKKHIEFELFPKEIRLIESPYYVKPDEVSIPAEYYTARAMDNDGEEYDVIWRIKNKNCKNKAEVCDWANPYSISQGYINMKNKVALKL